MRRENYPANPCEVTGQPTKIRPAKIRQECKFNFADNNVMRYY
ncbi:hypothetical protein HMPREF0577_0430 [Mobiluncus mulieris ATCC 35243]|nr:hypothetical protein HMPREF0577_0430 [Mobiluncus mulieris ATCC 35243]